MAYKATHAIEAAYKYLGLNQSNVKVIPDTDKRGIIYNSSDGEEIVIFVQPIGAKKENRQIWLDTRDSGAEARRKTWSYAQENNLKYFMLAFNHENERFRDYVLSLESSENAISRISYRRSEKTGATGTQVNIPNNFIPEGDFKRERTPQGFYISAIHKNCILQYMQYFDNRTYMDSDQEDAIVDWDDSNQEAEIMDSSQESNLIDSYCDLPQNRIISGAPGTGKSFKYETEKDEYFSEYQYERVTFHPAYSYAHFFGCYKPVNGAEGIEYKFVPGPFVRVWLKAMADPEHNYLLLIEEINRAEVAAVFGDVFQLLDRKDGISQYPIDMSEDLRKYISNGEWQENIKTSMEEIDTSQKMVIPQNMFIWATMNSADQGVYPMDTAFKRRWDYEYMPLDNKDVEKKLDTRNIQLVREKAGSEYKVQRFTWNEVRMAINNFLSGANINEDKLMGPFFLSDSVVGAGRDAENEIEFWKKFEEAFQNKVLLYLFEDAGKSKRPTLFEGAKPNHNRYSCIREEFANKGMRIFHEDISNKVHYYHNVDEAKQQEQNNKGETYEGSQP